MVSHVLKWIDLYNQPARAMAMAMSSITRGSSVATDPLSSVIPMDAEDLTFFTQGLQTQCEIGTDNLLALRQLLEEYRQGSQRRLEDWLEHCVFKRHLLPASHKFWQGVAAYARLKNIRRVWMYQEVMLASRVVIRVGQVFIG